MASFVILDRDGVINADSPDYIKSASEWLPLPGSVEAIARLTAAGYQVFVATNQAGIARGKLSLAALEAIHQRMIAEVADAVEGEGDDTGDKGDRDRGDPGQEDSGCDTACHAERG